MELKAIRLFIALADALHFGKAATRAGVTQSVLSVQIKRLEDVIGTPLFARTTRNVRLTQAGLTFREEAEGILRRIDQATRAAQATARGSGRLLRIGITSAVEVSNLMDRIARFRLDRPEIQVLIRELGTVDQEAALVNGEINIGILHPPVDQADLTLLSLSTDAFCAVYHPTFYRLRQPLAWPDLFAQPLVFYPRRRAPRMYDGLVGFAHARSISTKIVAEAESFFAAVAMAQAGLGIALLPRGLLHLSRDLCIAELPDDCPLSLETACAFHARSAEDALVETAARYLAEDPLS